MEKAKQRDPKFVNQVLSLVESGMDPMEIITSLQASVSNSDSNEDEEEVFPDEIKLISQALAFREPSSSDFEEIFKVLSSAYKIETTGPESFRSGDPISKNDLYELFSSGQYKWLVVEAPSGRNIVEDGAILGVCCFSTDGVSRKNGEVEGNLGSMRYFCVLPKFQGLLIGRRLLHRAEMTMFQDGCCRSMICVPSCRVSVLEWMNRRSYSQIGQYKYPVGLGHQLNQDVSLIVFIKTLEAYDGKSLLASGKTENKWILNESSSSPENEPCDPPPLSSQNSSSAGQVTVVDGNGAPVSSNMQSTNSRMQLSPIWRAVSHCPHDPDPDQAQLDDAADGK